MNKPRTFNVVESNKMLAVGIGVSVLLLLVLLALLFYLFRYSPRVRKIHANRKLLLYEDLAFSTSLSKKGLNAPTIKPLRKHAWQKQQGIDLVVLTEQQDEDQQDDRAMRACIQGTVTSRKYTGFHCAAICDTSLEIVKSMLWVAPEVVAVADTKNNDAVQLAVQHGASADLVSAMTVRCLETGVPFNGWHYLLDNDSHSQYIIAILKLVHKEAASTGIGVRPTMARLKKSNPLAPQVTSIEQEAVHAISQALDTKQRFAIDVATKGARKLLEERIFYLGRFNTLPGKKVHESKDSLVMVVDDAESKQLVALKMMVREEQWARETAMRKTEDSEGLAAHVLPILHSFVDKKALGCDGHYPYGHVLPAAEMDLNDFLQHNQVEGNTLYALTFEISRQIAEHTQFLHEICSMIHGAQFECSKVLEHGPDMYKSV